jgi:phage terminase small subunit
MNTSASRPKPKTTTTTTTTTLNPRQLLFAQSVVSGMSLTAAYRAAGYTGEDHVAHAGASKLMAKPAVASFVEAHQQTATLSAIADRREIIARLTRVVRADAETLEHDPPIQQVVRRTVVKADGVQTTFIRSQTLSRHAAIRQLSRMLGLTGGNSRDKSKSSPGLARDELCRQRDRDLARSEIDTACASLPPADLSEPHLPGDHVEASTAITRIGRHLNPRQRLFCEYLSQGIPAIRAYRHAGYGVWNPSLSADAAGEVDVDAACASRLLRRPAIAAYLRDLRLYNSNPKMGEGRGPGASPACADLEELLTYLTHATRATEENLRTQGRFIDQVIREEVHHELEGLKETRTWVRSIAVPRAMAQLFLLLDPGSATETADDADPEFRILRELLAAAAPPAILPDAADRASM